MGVPRLQHLHGTRKFDWLGWLAEFESSATSGAYYKDLRYFAAWHTSKKSKDVSESNINEALRDLINETSYDANVLVNGYRKAMLDEGLAGNTVKRRLATLCSLGKQAGVALSPKKVRAVNVKDTRGPTLEEGKLILHRAGNKNPQDYLALSMIMTMGVRSGELIGVLKNDVHADTLTVKRKAYNDKRHLSIPNFLGTLIRGQTERLLGWKLFSYSTSGLYRMCKSYGFSPHAYRHFAATLAINNGYNVYDVGQLLGHSDPKTTMRYYDQHRDIAKVIAEDNWRTICGNMA